MAVELGVKLGAVAPSVPFHSNMSARELLIARVRHHHALLAITNLSVINNNHLLVTHITR